MQKLIIDLTQKMFAMNKRILNTIVLIFMMCTAWGQWTNTTFPKLTTGSAEIEGLAPRLQFDIQGPLWGGIWYAHDNLTDCHTFYDATNNQFNWQLGSTYDNTGNGNQFTFDMDLPDVSGTANGGFTIGALNGTRMTFDQNEIAAKSSSGPSALYLNHDGGLVGLNAGNTSGDVQVGLNASLYVDNSARRVGIGTNAPGDDLHIKGVNSADIRIEANLAKYIRFYEGGTQKAYIGHTGTNMLLTNNETNGNVEIYGQAGVELQVNGAIAMEIDNTRLIDIPRNAEALRLSGSSSYMTFYNAGSYNGYLWHDNVNMHLVNRNVSGSLRLGTNNGIKATLTAEGDFGIGTISPVEKLHVTGNMTLNSPETGGSTAENRNHLIYGLGGKKRLQFSSDATAQTSWAWINMFGDETCASCEGVTKRGNMSMAGQRIIMRTANTDANFGDVAVEIDPNQDMHVTGDIYSGGILVSSDRRLKRDIKDFAMGLEAVRKINPKTYQYNGEGGIATTRRPHVGVLAQEFKKIAPEHVLEYTFNDPVHDISENYLAVDEGMIKFMLINSIKELDDQNKKLNEENARVLNELNRMEENYADLEVRMQELESLLLKKNTDQQVLLKSAPVDMENSVLFQNQPNPFSQNTVIRYVLSEDVNEAQLSIFDLNGKVIKSMKLIEPGAGQVTLDAYTLNAGVYTYQLTTDQGVVDSKTMIVVK